jgi:hypothetical protein
MTPGQILREKLHKIEALFAGAATTGEKAAAGVEKGAPCRPAGSCLTAQPAKVRNASNPDWWMHCRQS